MGGPGSGVWHRSDTKDTTDSRMQVDIRGLRRSGKLINGWSRHLTWNYGKDDVAIGECYVQNESFFLTYEMHRSGSERKKEIIELEYTSMGFDCTRTWFKCTDCRKRAVVLYHNGSRFLCRRCCKLVYSSQRENKIDRMMYRSKLIRAKLGGTGSLSDPFPSKPKGMHWRTYWLLYKRAHDLEQPFWSRAMKEINSQPLVKQLRDP